MEIHINKAYIPALKSKKRYLLLYGGAGSGKSVFAAQKIIIRTLTEPNHRFLLIRKVARTIRQSIYAEIINQINKLNLANEFHITINYIKHLKTGNELIFAGLDDPEKIKSIHNITGILIEEATELTAEDFDQLDLRLRTPTDNYKQIIIVFNPISNKTWIYKRFFDNNLLKNKTTYIKTTVHDNKHIDKEYIKILELRASVNPNYYRIYFLGEWGEADILNRYAYNFQFDRHVSPQAEYRRDKRVYISFDFNLNPFVCILAHIWRDEYEHIHIFDEIAIFANEIPPGRSMIEVMAERIITRLTPAQLATAIITGDATQLRRDINLKSNMNSYNLLSKYLQISPQRIKIKPANPRNSDFNIIFNTILALHKDLKINPICKILINELQYTEADDDGNIKKHNREKEEQRADALDCLKYLFYNIIDWRQFLPPKPSKAPPQPPKPLKELIKIN